MVFYEPGKTDHGLPHDPFKACVVPRPIGWISTLNTDGSANLAPYSQFNNLTFSPPLVMFSANHRGPGKSKDTVINAEREGEFCWSLATYELREAVNLSAEQVEYGVDEFELAKVGKEHGKVVRAPMVKESPVRFECKYQTTFKIPGDGDVGSVDIVVGRVVGIHIDERVLTNGILDVAKTRPIARCGYWQYTVITETFDMIIPGDARTRAGLAGEVKAFAEGGEEQEEGKKASESLAGK